MPARIVSFNGRFVPEAAARVSIFDSALVYGDMAFEMTRTFQHRPFHLRTHLERLLGSLAFLQIDCGLSLDELEQLTAETLARNLSTEDHDVDWHIRHDVSRGPLPLYADAVPADELRPTVLISCWPLIKHMGKFAPLYETGVDLGVSPQRVLPPDLIDPRAKTRSRVHFQLAQLDGQRRNIWPILADARGCLCEGPSWNVFFVRGRELLTPRSEEILHGVSQRITTQAAESLGLTVREDDVTPEAAATADEIFCTATSFGLVHARTFEGRPLGDGRPGPTVRALTHAWQATVGLDFIAQARSYASRVAAWEARERAAVLSSHSIP